MEYNHLTEEQYLSRYNADAYERLSIATDIVAFSISRTKEDNVRKLPEQHLGVLMIKRAEHPFKDQWALPGGFVKPDETVDETARRELQEETGVEGSYLEQLYTFSEPERDPRTRVVSCAYMALLSNRPNLVAATDAADAKWFDITYKLCSKKQEMLEDGVINTNHYCIELRNEEIILEAEIECIKKLENLKVETEYRIISSKNIAFDHAKIIAFAIERLRGKIEYTDLALNLMPERFTLTMLLKTYELILDKELIRTNFTRKIAGLVTETDEFEEVKGHRPSRLLKRNIENMLIY